MLLPLTVFHINRIKDNVWTMDKGERRIVLVVHNIRSAYNVGALLRTADGLGVNKVILSGYTPYPAAAEDDRLPHVAQKTNRAIQKTALGAEISVAWEKIDNIQDHLNHLRNEGYQIAALEQTTASQNLPDFRPPDKLVLLVGNEVDGLEADLLNSINVHLQIPMLGAKESLNVAAAAAIALYHLRYAPLPGVDKHRA
jgi:23S rRNA (guanosine2251-2'-O)-methyltransferase